MAKDKQNEPEEHQASVLPAREVMSLISPGSTSVPGLGGLLGGDPTGAATGADPTGTGATDPTTAPGAGTTDLASGLAQHAADGQQADQPSISDQPQTLSTSDTDSASAGG